MTGERGRKDMVGVEGWAEIRRLHFVKGLSIREVASEPATGETRCTGALRADGPPRYRARRF